jgi:polar amino acid transport system substrate-binding protein
MTSSALDIARAELAPRGVLRAALNLGNTVLVQRAAESGDVQGVSVDLARELARRLGVPVEFFIFDAAGKVFEALASDAWDLAFLAIDPARAREIEFTAPYLLIEGAYVVRDGAPYKTSAEVDRPGVHVAVGKGSAYALYLGRNLQHAQLDLQPTGAEAFATFMDHGLEAAAGVRQVASAFAAKHAGLRVLDDSFMTIRQALGVPKARAAAIPFLAAFVEEMKSRGAIAESLLRSGQSGATVAPPASV